MFLQVCVVCISEIRGFDYRLCVLEWSGVKKPVASCFVAALALWLPAGKTSVSRMSEAKSLQANRQRWRDGWRNVHVCTPFTDHCFLFFLQNQPGKTIRSLFNHVYFFTHYCAIICSLSCCFKLIFCLKHKRIFYMIFTQLFSIQEFIVITYCQAKSTTHFVSMTHTQYFKSCERQFFFFFLWTEGWKLLSATDMLPQNKCIILLKFIILWDLKWSCFCKILPWIFP